MKFDESYINVLKNIHDNGCIKSSRPGTDTKSIFTVVIEAEDSAGWNGIPISQLRKIYYKGAIIETLWLLGLHMKDDRYKNLPMTNTRYLEDYGVRYWRPWQDINGNLGPVYGEQLVNWYDHNTGKHINQIQNIIDTLRTNPTDRRLVASMWNPAEIPNMALPPCHHSLWFYSRENENGEKIFVKSTHPESEVVTTLQRIFDEEGNLVTYIQDTGYYVGRYEYSYNRKNQRIREEYYRNDELIDYTDFVWEGNVGTATAYDADGTPLGKQILEYDDFGNLLRQESQDLLGTTLSLSCSEYIGTDGSISSGIPE